MLRTPRAASLLLLTFVFCFSAYSQNQTNPHTGIKWPQPACATGAYAPASNTCIPMGTAANPAGVTTDVQLNLAGSFGADASHNFQYDATAHKLFTAEDASKLPTADVTHKDFGTAAGCNPADKTGTLDQTCNWQAAINYSLTQPVTNQVRVCVYAPPGKYLISGTLTWNVGGAASNVCIRGDGPQSVVILRGPGSQNGITVKNTSIPNGTGSVASMYGGGYIGGLQFSSGSNANTGADIELNNSSSITIDNVIFSNYGGRAINMYGDTERTQVYNSVFFGGNIAVDQGFQTNENRFMDDYLLFNGISASGNCYHLGYGCDPNTNKFPVAHGNAGRCNSFPSWTANHVYDKGSFICDGSNLEVATTNGTSGPSTPAWSATEHAFTCDGSSADCSATPVPFGKSDWTGPIQWQNASDDTILPPDPTPQVVLWGNKNTWDGGSQKPLTSTASFVNLGLANSINHVYCEASPSNGQPGRNSCVHNGSIDGGLTTSFGTSGVTSSAETFPVVSVQYYFGVDLGTDADAAAGNSPFNAWAIVPPDYDPTAGAVPSTAPGFSAFNKNDVERITVRGCSFQSNTCYGSAASRCQTGTSAHLGCSVGGGVGVAWPTGYKLIENATAGASLSMYSVHNTSINTHGGPGYITQCSDTLNYLTYDNRKSSLSCGDWINGPQPDGSAYTNVASGVLGWAGSPFSMRATIEMHQYLPTTGVDLYSNQATIYFPLAGVAEDYNDIGLNANILPTGITSYCTEQSVRPAFAAACKGSSIANVLATRPSMGLVWHPSTAGSNTGAYTRQIRWGDGLGMQNGFQFFDQWCTADMPQKNSTGTQPLIRMCMTGGPDNASPVWEVDSWSGSAWVPQVAWNSATGITSITSTQVQYNVQGQPGSGSGYVCNINGCDFNNTVQIGAGLLPVTTPTSSFQSTRFLQWFKCNVAGVDTNQDMSGQFIPDTTGSTPTTILYTPTFPNGQCAPVGWDLTGLNIVKLPAGSTVGGAAIGAPLPIRAGVQTLTTATSVAVTFAVPMSVTPSDCSLTLRGNPSVAAVFWTSGYSTSGFTINASAATTATLGYQCVINNTN